MYAFRIIVAALVLAPALAHPGHDVGAEAARRREFLATHTNNLDHCASIHKASGLDLRNVARRAQLHHGLRKRKGVKPRQLSSINKSHKSDKPFTLATDHKAIFSGKAACVLTPEGTEGPFYVTGEAIRSKVVDTEKGIPLHLDIQLVDATTCQPIKGQFVEIWNANSTGVYSGANALVNGVGMSDIANLNKGFLRGAQMTDDDGVAQFETIFPGHYAGRATHVHVMTHLNAKAEANDTIWHTAATHAGQIFFDQALITAVEKTAPYTTNRQGKTANSADAILAAEAATSDPFFEFVHLGDDISAGVLAWYTIAVNQSFSRPIMAVAAKYKEGGKMATTNPKVPGLDQIFPGGFPTAYQPGYGPPAAAPTGKKGKGGM